MSVGPRTDKHKLTQFHHHNKKRKSHMAYVELMKQDFYITAAVTRPVHSNTAD